MKGEGLAHEGRAAIAGPARGGDDGQPGVVLGPVLVDRPFDQVPGGGERVEIVDVGAQLGEHHLAVARKGQPRNLLRVAAGIQAMQQLGQGRNAVTEACRKHGGFYLGSIGGPAAILAKENIRKVELLEYPELGMEAIYRIEVEDFPAFILVDDKGNDFFRQLD